MRFSDLSSETIENIKKIRFDRIYEKHEGPWKWKDWLGYDELEFIEMHGYQVLLPIDKQYHMNITPLRVIPSADTKVLTIFFRDTTFFGEDSMDAGFLAICEKMPSEEFYIATVYHEWFMFENGIFKIP